MFRRQSLRQTAKQVQGQLDDPDARDSLMDWWYLAEDTFTTERGTPSPLTEFLARSMALSMAEAKVANVPAASLLAGIRAGYAVRMKVFFFGAPDQMDVTSLPGAHLVEMADRLPDPDTGLIGISEPDLGPLDATTQAVNALTNERFEEIVSVGPDRWNALVSLATYQLQKNTPRGRKLHRDAVEMALRYGFVLRALDEALGIETAADK
jgi:hypothetical protein